jgi:hypothetical protein
MVRAGFPDRFLVCVSFIGLVIVALAGCGSKQGQLAAVTVAPGLTLQLPAGWEPSSPGAKSAFVTPSGCNVQVWTVENINQIAEALPKAAEIIKEAVKNFKIVTTNDITVAGMPAKHLIGTGLEADDDDDSNSEVFIFSMGDRVFLLCAHSEGSRAADVRADVLKMLDTAKPQ